MLLPSKMTASLVFAATTLAAQTGVALACSQPLCWPAEFAVPNRAQVPANVPALLFSPARATNGQQSQASSFVLRDDQGQEVPVEVTPVAAGSLQQRVRPTMSLAAGKTYEAEFALDCDDAPAVHRVFTAGPASDLPSTIGTAVASGHRLGMANAPVDIPGMCPGTTVPVAAALAKVTLSLSPEMRAYWPLASLSARAGQKGVHLTTQTISSNGDIDVEVYAACGASTAGADPGLAPGRHTIEFKAALAGIPTNLRPLTATVELSCMPAEADAGVSDGGLDATPDAGAPGDAAKPGDGSILDAAPVPPPMASGGGCSMVSDRAGGNGVAAAFATLTAMLLIRRKKQRGSRT